MSNFKVGDLVERVTRHHMGMNPGDKATVTVVHRDMIILDGYGGRHESQWFKLAPIGDPDDSPRDDVNHPAHYTSDPSGVECITITRHRNFNIGNVIKYIWRLGLKESAGKSAKEKTLQDIDKAIWYLQDERARIEAAE